jgi:hypothetical protein
MTSVVMGSSYAWPLDDEAPDIARAPTAAAGYTAPARIVAAASRMAASMYW